ncbi:MAG: hypothetical protein ACPGLV_12345 [Bacteroidia bacterium]
MKNKLNIFLIASNVIIIALFLMSSTGILISTGTGNPDGSAMLEIKSSDKGLLIPRVDLDDISSNTSPVNAPAEGLLVYNDGGDQAEGFYYWDEDHDQWNSVVNEVKPVRYHMPSNASVSTGWNRVNFSASTFDNNSTSPVSVGSNWAYTAPTDGYYSVKSQLYFNIGSSTNAWLILNHNGARKYYMDVHSSKSLNSVNNAAQAIGSDIVYLEKGDYVYIDFYAGTSGTLFGGGPHCSVTISYEGN